MTTSSDVAANGVTVRVNSADEGDPVVCIGGTGMPIYAWDIAKTVGEQLIERYFDAFNRHDVVAVMGCFHDAVVLVDTAGTRVEGLDAGRKRYEEDFALMPDAYCELRMVTGRDERGVAESIVRGTIRDGGPVRAVGTEVMEFADGKIKEIRGLPPAGSGGVLSGGAAGDADHVW